MINTRKKCLWTEKIGTTVADVKNCTQNGEYYLFTGEKEWTKCP
jgi:hypothetical protein